MRRRLHSTSLCLPYQYSLVLPLMLQSILLSRVSLAAHSASLLLSSHPTLKVFHYLARYITLLKYYTVPSQAQANWTTCSNRSPLGRPAKRSWAPRFCPTAVCAFLQPCFRPHLRRLPVLDSPSWARSRPATSRQPMRQPQMGSLPRRQLQSTSIPRRNPPAAVQTHQLRRR